MKKTRQIIGIKAMFITCILCFMLATISACDTPKSIAWSYYYCAKDTLDKGDAYAAKHFLDCCKKEIDKSLTLKADSLMEVIDQAIEKDKNHKSSQE